MNAILAAELPLVPPPGAPPPNPWGGGILIAALFLAGYLVVKLANKSIPAMSSPGWISAVIPGIRTAVGFGVGALCGAVGGWFA